MKFGDTGNFGLIMPDGEIVTKDKRAGKEFKTELQALDFGKEVLDSMATQLEVAKINEIGVDFMQTSKEIRDKITELHIEMDEVLGNLASHSLDLSNCHQRTRERYINKIRQLEDKLKAIKRVNNTEQKEKRDRDIALNTHVTNPGNIEDLLG
jgi:CRISPR/Cas system-associated endonuclease Cas3-HD